MEFNNEKVAYLENIDFDSSGNLTSETTKPVVIMIYGTHCPHCHTAMPEYIKASNANPKVMFAAIVTDSEHADKALVGRLSNFIPNLQGVPTFVLFRNGKYIKTHNGARTAAALKAFYES